MDDCCNHSIGVKSRLRAGTRFKVKGSRGRLKVQGKRLKLRQKKVRDK